MRKYLNRFTGNLNPPKIPKETAFHDIDTGEIYKWNGDKWIKVSDFKGRINASI